MTKISVTKTEKKFNNRRNEQWEYGILEFGIKMNLYHSIITMSLYKRTTMYNKKDINPN
jgi:hypothetical protein